MHPKQAKACKERLKMSEFPMSHPCDRNTIVTFECHCKILGGGSAIQEQHRNNSSAWSKYLKQQIVSLSAIFTAKSATPKSATAGDLAYDVFVFKGVAIETLAIWAYMSGVVPSSPRYSDTALTSAFGRAPPSFPTANLGACRRPNTDGVCGRKSEGTGGHTVGDRVSAPRGNSPLASSAKKKGAPR